MLWLSIALAGPGQSGTLLPGAVPMPRAAGYVGAGGIFGNVENKGLGGGGAIEFGVGRDVSLMGHVHSWAIHDVGSGSIAALGLRAQLVDEAPFRLAGFVGAALVRDGRLHFFPGLAFEAGSEKVRVDLTLMPWTVGYRVGRHTWSDQVPRGRVAFGSTIDPRWTHGGAFPLGSIGVSVPIHLGGSNRIRFGYPELVAWHHVGERVYYDLGGVLFGATFGPHFKVGMLLGPDRD